MSVFIRCLFFPGTVPGLQELMVNQNRLDPSSCAAIEFFGELDHPTVNKYVKTYCGHDNVEEVQCPLRAHN
jgi:hypothetical protein